MKKNAALVLSIILAAILFILFIAAAYTVDETEQVIITRFGRPVREPIKAPGIRFKVPFVEEVHRFEKRIMEWDSDHREVPTQDKKFIRADATARWKIVDPLVYYKVVKTESQAQSRLDAIVGGAMKNEISSRNLIESVRSTGRPFEILEEDSFSTAVDPNEYTIEDGRHHIGTEIMRQANKNLKDFGIELVDVRLRRINYKETVRREVYQRMIAERERMADFYRSEGLGRQMKIEGEREKELKTIESVAYRTAEETRGQADAEATRVFAEAYGQDPEFFAFLKTLETYEATVGEGVELILTTNSDFFKYLKSMGDPETWKKD